MPRELVTVSVGQCGNQIAQRFWQQAVVEHAVGSDGLFDDGLSSFFRNLDGSGAEVAPPKPGRGAASAGGPPSRAASLAPIVDLRARAVLVDSEEGVVGSIKRGPLRDLFAGAGQVATPAVSGAGNNWAHGCLTYGPAYREELSQAFRAQAEACDSLQGFLLTHSLGGGTGSGLGSHILQQLEDEYPAAQRFAVSVFPSADDDVVTSPYNALLSLQRLAEHADAVLPLENAALLAVCASLEGRRGGGGGGGGGGAAAAARPGGAAQRGAGSGWEGPNALAASVLLDLTASARFEGPLNMDFNEICTNLVPYPRGLHFILPAMAPLPPTRISLAGGGAAARAPAAAGAAAGPAPTRAIEQAFMEVLQPNRQLMEVQLKQHTCLACGLVARGAVSASDLPRNVERLRSHIKLPPWNADAFKTALCSRPPVGQPFSLLCLANSCGVAGTFEAMAGRFHRLYSRRLYVHHYEEHGLERGDFESAADMAAWLAGSYRQLGDPSQQPDLARLRPRDAMASSCGKNRLR